MALEERFSFGQNYFKGTIGDVINLLLAQV